MCTSETYTPLKESAPSEETLEDERSPSLRLGTIRWNNGSNSPQRNNPKSDNFDNRRKQNASKGKHKKDRLQRLASYSCPQQLPEMAPQRTDLPHLPQQTMATAGAKPATNLEEPLTAMAEITTISSDSVTSESPRLQETAMSWT